MSGREDIIEGESKQSLARKAYNELLKRLLSNELVPGENINRRDIAKEFDMSVAPVLEAMLQLEVEGFLKSVARKGTQVKPIRTTDIVGMLVVREALECQAARMYCGKPIEDNLKVLRPLVQDLESTNAADPYHWQREIEFHRKLVDLAQCEQLSVEFKRCINLNVFYGINKLLPTEGGMDRQRHDQLLDDLCIADPDQAERVIREHVRSAKGNLLNMMS